MIFGNTDHLDAFSFLEEAVRKCFAYAQQHNLAEFSTGTHEIDGNNLFVNIVEYTTKMPEERPWEAHRKYLDVHLMLKGTEQIDLNFLHNMEVKAYAEEEDFVQMEGRTNSCVILTKGDFLVCYPDDAHRTAVKVGEPQEVKKAIFKVLI